MNDTFSLLEKYIGISKYSKSEVITPQWVVSDMVDLLPADVFSPEAKFLDPAVKSGRFLVEIYNRLMESGLMKQAFPNEQYRHRHIIEKQLFGFATSMEAAIVVRKSLYDDPFYTGNIRFTSDKLTKELIQGAFNNMRFDVVIGNPPYNKGMDIDFINLGFELSTKYCVMIVPAKWQTAEANQKIASEMTYGKFREKLVPHMSHVVFYPDCKDVFDIAIPEGITYFVLDKGIHSTCKIENRCKYVEGFNSTTNRSILESQSLHNIGDEINKTLQNVPKFTFSPLAKDGNFDIWVGNQVSFGKTDRSYLVSTTNNLLVTGITTITDRAKHEWPSSNSALHIFRANTYNEAKSFESFIQTKFVRFMILMTIGSRSVMDNHHFRFVPVPTPDTKGHPYGHPDFKWDHIYTDKELYQYYKLPQKYTDVIEAVIKERKL